MCNNLHKSTERARSVVHLSLTCIGFSLRQRVQYTPQKRRRRHPGRLGYGRIWGINLSTKRKRNKWPDQSIVLLRESLRWMELCEWKTAATSVHILRFRTIWWVISVVLHSSDENWVRKDGAGHENRNKFHCVSKDSNILKQDLRYWTGFHIPQLRFLIHASCFQSQFQKLFTNISQ